MKKEDIYLDLSNLSESERMLAYKLSDLEYDNIYKYIFYDIDDYCFDATSSLNYRYIKGKTEVTFNQFKELFKNMKEITEHQMQQLINLNDSKVNEILGVNTYNNWYKYKNTDYLMYIHDNGRYGFKTNGDWASTGLISLDSLEEYILATNEEVANALINEAKKRGLVKGTKLTRSWTAKKEVCINDDEYELYDDKTLLLYGYEIFKDGKWAEVINKQEIINQINELLKQL